jgi:hypothetical protein
MPGGVYSKSVYDQDLTDLPTNMTRYRAFEWQAKRFLEDRYPKNSFDYLANDQVEHHDGNSDCPDFVIKIHGTDHHYVCVAECKCCKRLQKKDVQKVVRYRDRRVAQYPDRKNAIKAMVIIPKNCHVQRGATKSADDLSVEIWPI